VIGILKVLYEMVKTGEKGRGWIEESDVFECLFRAV
jgi:hypothetical protein